MDFFGAQIRARRISWILLVWFALAVLGIAVSVHAVIWVAFWLDGPFWDPRWFGASIAATALVVGGGAAVRVSELARGGGAVVARSLGGRAVQPGSTTEKDRRLLNIIEEMAIAAGLPVPPAYVLEREGSINAFAAGDSPQQAVVAVTRGALDRLSRDELQGVIAHEFSHILNGDMRLNLRLLGLVHGLMLLSTIGRFLLEHAGRANRRGSSPGLLVAAAGLALMVIGWLGVLFGRMIQAAVSRQREFLADAHAVQFTRNPDGIAGALRRIASGGAELMSPAADTVSHMLFGAGRSFDWFASHPPVKERISRILGRPSVAAWQGEGVRSGPDARTAGFAATTVGDQEVGAAVIAPHGAGWPTGFLRLRHAHLAEAAAVVAQIPGPIREVLASREGARVGIFALLLGTEVAVRERRLADLGDDAVAVERLARLLPKPGSALRMAVIDLTLGTLKSMPRAAADVLIGEVNTLVGADGATRLSEFLLLRFLSDALIPVWSPPIGVQRSRIVVHVRALLSYFSYAGHSLACEQQEAYSRGAAVATVDLPSKPMPQEDLRIDMLEAAFTEMAGTSEGFRQRLIAALAEVVSYDEKITAPEAEFLRVAAGALAVAVPLPLSIEEDGPLI